MNRSETARLAAMIETLDPRVRFDGPRLLAWAELLEDVPADLARQALVEHYRSSAYPILPVDVRRRAAAAAGLLAPPEAVAWAYAVRVAQAGGEGRSRLHPAILAAYDVLGGARGPLRDGGSTARAQFRDTYRQIADGLDGEVLSARIPAMRSITADGPAKIVANVDDKPRSVRHESV